MSLEFVSENGRSAKQVRMPCFVPEANFVSAGVGWEMTSRQGTVGHKPHAFCVWKGTGKTAFHVFFFSLRVSEKFRLKRDGGGGVVDI